MHWKYYVRADDLVRFKYNGIVAEGSVWKVAWPPDAEDENGEIDVEEVGLDELFAVINSGGTKVIVPLCDIVERKMKARHREDELVGMGEEFRLSEGIEQKLDEDEIEEYSQELLAEKLGV